MIGWQAVADRVRAGVVGPGCLGFELGKPLELEGVAVAGKLFDDSAFDILPERQIHGFPGLHGVSAKAQGQLDVQTGRRRLAWH